MRGPELATQDEAQSRRVHRAKDVQHRHHDAHHEGQRGDRDPRDAVGLQERGTRGGSSRRPDHGSHRDPLHAHASPVPGGPVHEAGSPLPGLRGGG